MLGCHKDRYLDHVSTVCIQNQLMRYVADIICSNIVFPTNTQVYMAIMSKTTWFDIAKKLETCLADISTWMSANMPKLNEEKTELIIFNPKHQVGINEELRFR